MATFHVQRQPWQRWPRTLVCVAWADVEQQVRTEHDWQQREDDD